MSAPAHSYDYGTTSDALGDSRATGKAPVVLRLHLLGGFRAERPGGVPPAARWPRPGARTLVKLLALAPGHQLHRDHVMAACWPHAELDAALRNLRVALHTARHALEPELPPRARSSYLLADGALLRLAPDTVVVDADRAEELAESALSGDDPGQLAAAFAEFKGELLPEDPYAAWADAPRARLAALRARVGLALAGHHLDVGAPARAADVARRLLDQDPADERAHQTLMEAWLRQGMRQEAVRQYEECAAALDAGPGTRPGARTERLRRTALAGADADAEPEPAVDAARVRLDWARSLDRAGRYDEAIDVLRQALSAYEEQGRADACALTAARLAEVLARTRGADEAHAVLRAHPPGPDAGAEVRAAHHMARSIVVFHGGDYEAGLTAARAAQGAIEADASWVGSGGRIGEGVGRRPGRGAAGPGPHAAQAAALLARALSQQAVCNGLLGRFGAALGPAEQALAPAEAAGDPALLASVLSVLRENARRAGRPRQALEYGRRALSLAERAGRPTATAFERANLAELHLILGETAEADRIARAGVELAEPFGGTVLAFALTALARVRSGAEPEAAAALLDRAERCARAGGHRQAVDEVGAARAELAAGRLVCPSPPHRAAQE